MYLSPLRASRTHHRFTPLRPPISPPFTPRNSPQFFLSIPPSSLPLYMSKHRRHPVSAADLFETVTLVRSHPTVNFYAVAVPSIFFPTRWALRVAALGNGNAPHAYESMSKIPRHRPKHASSTYQIREYRMMIGPDDCQRTLLGHVTSRTTRSSVGRAYDR